MLEAPSAADPPTQGRRLGATASAFGIAAAASAGDTGRRSRLVSQLGGRAIVEASHGSRLSGIPIGANYVTGFLLGDATLLYALTYEVEP